MSTPDNSATQQPATAARGGIRPDQVFRRSEDVVHRSIAGEALLVPIRSNLADMQKVFTLNPVAEFIWNQLDGTKDCGEIVNQVVAAFEVAREDAAADLHRLVADLEEAGLIARVS